MSWFWASSGVGRRAARSSHWTFKPMRTWWCHYDAWVCSPLNLPAVMHGFEVLLVLAGQHGPQLCGLSEMHIIIRASEPKLGHHINQMARRAKLTGHVLVDETLVKVEGYYDEPPWLCEPLLRGPASRFQARAARPGEEARRGARSSRPCTLRRRHG